MNIMVISGRFTLWDVNKDLQSYIKNNGFHTICSINSKEYVFPSLLISNYNIVYHNINDVFNMKLLDKDTMIRINNHKARETPVDNVLSMYYNHYLNSQYLKTFDTKYKNVFYNRFDLFISNSKDYDILRSICNQDIPDDVIYIPTNFDFGGINDQMAIGNIQTMIKYLSLFESISHYINYDKIMFHPETLLKHHLITKKIQVKRFSLNYYLHKSRHL